MKEKTRRICMNTYTSQTLNSVTSMAQKFTCIYIHVQVPVHVYTYNYTCVYTRAYNCLHVYIKTVPYNYTDIYIVCIAVFISLTSAIYMYVDQQKDREQTN